MLIVGCDLHTRYQRIAIASKRPTNFPFLDYKTCSSVVESGAALSAGAEAQI